LIGSLVPSLIKIRQVEKMLYKEIIARKDLKIKELEKEIEKLKGGDIKKKKLRGN
jgi:ABC-type iron transport system FetAB ATPase subunit